MERTICIEGGRLFEGSHYTVYLRVYCFFCYHIQTFREELKNEQRIAIGISIALAFLCAIGSVVCLERVKPGNVGVVYSTGGVEERTLSQGWHWLSPMKHVKQFPI